MRRGPARIRQFLIFLGYFALFAVEKLRCVTGGGRGSTMHDENRLSIDSTILELPVRKVLQNNSAVVETWRCNELRRGVHSRRVLRVSGTARASGNKNSWE